METKSIKRVFSRIGLGMFLFMIIQQGIAGVAVVLVTMFAPQIAQSGWFVWLASYVPLYLIAFPIFALVLKTIPDCIPSAGEYPVKNDLSPRDIIFLVFVSLGMVYPLNALSTLLATLIGFFKGGDVMNPLMDMVQNSSPWASFLFVVIIAPVMEEIIFRKFLYNKLIGFGGKTYVFFSAFIFALFHGNIYQLIYAFALGILLAYIMYRTRDIRYCIALHFAVNLLGSGISAFVLSYAGMYAAGIYGFVMLAAAVAGIIMGVRWLRKNRSQLEFSPPEIQIERRKIIFANAGMICYMAATLILIVFTVLV